MIASAGVKGSNSVKYLEERLRIYKESQQTARTNGNMEKVRRLDVTIKSLQEQLRAAKSCKQPQRTDITNFNLSPVTPPSDNEFKDNEANLAKPITPPWTPTPETSPLLKRKDEEAHSIRGLTLSEYVLNEHNFMLEPDYDYPLDSMKCQDPPLDLNLPQSSSLNEISEASRASTEESSVSDETRQILANPPKSLLETLRIRRDEFAKKSKKAEICGNEIKKRRYSKSVMMYEEAIKAHRTGRHFDLDELPTPPGFPSMQFGFSESSSEASNSNLAPSTRSLSPFGSLQSKSDDELDFPMHVTRIKRILERRKNEYENAVLEALERDEIEKYEKFNTALHNIEDMLKNLNITGRVERFRIPPPPNAKALPAVSFDSGIMDAENREEKYHKIETELKDQIKFCDENQEKCFEYGHTSLADKFKDWGKKTRRELSSLKRAFRNDDKLPEFLKESRSFSYAKSFPHLENDELEILAIRAHNLPIPDGFTAQSLVTLLKYEFAHPKDNPQSGDLSSPVKGTSYPEYRATKNLKIVRKSSSLPRLYELSLRIDLLYKRGFMKSDKVLGSTFLKLDSLKAHCECQKAYDLYQGQKKVGGQLEARLRVRKPLNGNVEELEFNREWLSMISFDDSSSSTSGDNHKKYAKNRPEKPVTPSAIHSLQVLKFERELVCAQLSRRNSLTAAQLAKLRRKHEKLGELSERTHNNLKKGGIPALETYVENVRELCDSYSVEMKSLKKAGEKESSKILAKKRELAEHEIKRITERLNKLKK